jgi:hypothetical protein
MLFQLVIKVAYPLLGNSPAPTPAALHIWGISAATITTVHGAGDVLRTQPA